MTLISPVWLAQLVYEGWKRPSQHQLHKTWASQDTYQKNSVNACFGQVLLTRYMHYKPFVFQIIQESLSQLDLALLPVDGVLYILNQHGVAIASENIIPCGD